MDNVTHALAGALLAAAACELTERRAAERGAEQPSLGFRRAAFIAGVVTAELPDADLVYAGAPMGMGNLGYLLHHRGHTHTVLFALVGAIVTWLVILAVRRRRTQPGERLTLFLLSLVGTLSHLALDFTNSYGVHPFWPVDRRWFYGDAVFIVEPWFWIVSLPPLFWVARRTAWRVLCAALLAIILVASWRVSMVGREVAIVLTLTAIAWTFAARAIPVRARVPVALTAWMALEIVFFAASGAVRRAVERDVGDAYRDVALSPSPGNPFCLSALLLRVDGDVYSARRAMVGSMPSVVSHDVCAGGETPATTANATPSSAGPRAIGWSEQWSGSVADLRTIVRSNCTVAAALRFVRIPRWERLRDGTVVVSDLRFGEGNGSFATVFAEPSSECPAHVPDWEYPRRDLLDPEVVVARAPLAGAIAEAAPAGIFAR